MKATEKPEVEWSVCLALGGIGLLCVTVGLGILLYVLPLWAKGLLAIVLGAFLMAAYYTST